MKDRQTDRPTDLQTDRPTDTATAAATTPATAVDAVAAATNQRQLLQLFNVSSSLI